jgi:hypothetical protein
MTNATLNFKGDEGKLGLEVTERILFKSSSMLMTFIAISYCQVFRNKDERIARWEKRDEEWWDMTKQIITMRDERWEMRDERCEMRDERWEIIERWEMRDERWEMRDERWEMRDERDERDERWEMRDGRWEMRDESLMKIRDY